MTSVLSHPPAAPAPTAPVVRMVSVIIATYGRGAILCDTIESLLKCEYPSWDLTVVDQTTSYDADVQLRLDALARNHAIRYIKLSPPNLPLARNVGIRATTGEIVLFCDDDVLVESDFVQRHADCYGDPGIGAIAGRLVRADGGMSDGSAEVGRVRPDGTFTANFDAGVRCECDWGAGCNMSFRRSALEQVNGFDERYSGTAYREDGDTFLRIKSRGFRVVFEPSASLIHLSPPGGGCRKDAEIRRHYSFFRNDTLFFFNCRDKRHLPRFMYRMAQWIWATVKNRGFTARDLIYFLTAIPDGTIAHFFHRRDRLTRRQPRSSPN